MKPVYPLLLSLYLGACIPLPQSPLTDKQQVKITGRILNLQGQPAAQQTVSLVTGSETYPLITDAQGIYQAELLGLETKSNLFGTAIDLRVSSRLPSGAEISYQQKVLTPAETFPDLRFWSGLTEPADGLQQRGNAQVFRWQAPSEPAPPHSYAFSLRDSQGHTVWYQQSNTPQVTVPGETFRANGIYSWQVSTQGQPRLNSAAWVLNGPAMDNKPLAIATVQAEGKNLAYLHDQAFDQTHPFPAAGGGLPQLSGPLLIDLGRSQPLKTVLVHTAKSWSGQVQVQISEDPNQWGDSIARLTPQGSWSADLHLQQGRYLRLSSLDNPRGFLDVSEIQVF